MNPLKQLETVGQAPWLDYLKRSLIEKGELRTLIVRDGLKGVTTNPFGRTTAPRQSTSTWLSSIYVLPTTCCVL